MSQESITQIGLSILMFPTLFQSQMMEFVWGASDPYWLMLFKRVFLLLPASGILAACWLSIACALTILIRIHRREFVSMLILTWWDLGRGILHFWSGGIRFLFYFVGSLAALLRFSVMGIWAAVFDLIFSPLRVAKDMGGGYLRPGIPWIAVLFTIFWCLLEAIIFTAVTTGIVIETLSGITGQPITEAEIQVPLFLMLFVFVLGSYAVLSTWVEAIGARKLGAVIKIGVFELFVMFLEVVFLYREFVDTLTPWLAQHTSSDFKLGLVGTLAISGFAWLGIRGLSWFLFANAGTPTILAIIQRKGVPATSGTPANPKNPNLAQQSTLIGQIIAKIKTDINWVYQKGDELISSFLLPPLQVLAAVINFVMLLILARTIFDLPFKSITEVASTKNLKGQVSTKND